MKLQTKIGKTNKHYTNCGWDNHNVNTCKVNKKKEPTITVIKATTHNHKVQKNSSYACHICGLNGHKMTNYPKFAKM